MTTRRQLLAGSSIGRQGFAPIPPAVTSNLPGPPPPSPDGMIDSIRRAAVDLGRDAMTVPPSCIVVDDDVPDGLDVSSNGLRFLTMSRATLESIRTGANPYVVEKAATGSPFLLGYPIADLADLRASTNTRGRALAGYYAAAIRGYQKGLGQA